MMTLSQLVNVDDQTVKIDTLCNINRFTDLTLLQTVMLLLYCPLGVLLACLRLLSIALISLIGYWLEKIRPGINKIYLIKAVLWTLGYQTETQGFVIFSDSMGKPGIVVSNHVALTGFWVLSQFGGTVVASKDASLLEKMLSSLCSVIFIHDLRSLRATIQRSFEQTSDLKIFISPEGTINNGKGLFRFQKFAFSLDKPVYPVVIRVIAPFGIKIATTSTNRSLSHICDYAWLLFLPYLKFELKFLPPQVCENYESPTDFANRVQIMIADSLGIPATMLTSKDKQELRQRLSKVNRG